VRLKPHKRQDRNVFLTDFNPTRVRLKQRKVAQPDKPLSTSTPQGCV